MDHMRCIDNKKVLCIDLFLDCTGECINKYVFVYYIIDAICSISSL